MKKSRIYSVRQPARLSISLLLSIGVLATMSTWNQTKAADIPFSQVDLGTLMLEAQQAEPAGKIPMAPPPPGEEALVEEEIPMAAPAEEAEVEAEAIEADDAREALLAEIRRGVQLHTVAEAGEEEETESVEKEGMEAVLEEIRRGVKLRPVSEAREEEEAEFVEKEGMEAVLEEFKAGQYQLRPVSERIAAEEEREKEASPHEELMEAIRRGIELRHVEREEEEEQPEERPVVEAIKEAIAERRDVGTTVEGLMEEHQEIAKEVLELVEAIDDRTEDIEANQQEVLQILHEIRGMLSAGAEAKSPVTIEPRIEVEPEERGKAFWQELRRVKQQLKPLSERIKQQRHLPLPVNEVARFEDELRRIKSELRPLEWRVRQEPELPAPGDEREAFLEELRAIKERLRHIGRNVRR